MQSIAVFLAGVAVGMYLHDSVTVIVHAIYIWFMSAVG